MVGVKENGMDASEEFRPDLDLALSGVALVAYLLVHRWLIENVLPPILYIIGLLFVLWWFVSSSLRTKLVR